MDDYDDFSMWGVEPEEDEPEQKVSKRPFSEITPLYDDDEDDDGCAPSHLIQRPPSPVLLAPTVRRPDYMAIEKTSSYLLGAMCVVLYGSCTEGVTAPSLFYSNCEKRESL